VSLNPPKTELNNEFKYIGKVISPTAKDRVAKEMPYESFETPSKLKNELEVPLIN